MRSTTGPFTFAAWLLAIAVVCGAPGAVGADDDSTPKAGDSTPKAGDSTPKAGETPAPEPDDTITLKNGSVWTGRIIQEDETKVIVEHTSKSGGVSRYTFPRTEILTIQRVEGVTRRPGAGPRPLRDEWFLLRRGGKIIGTRRLELWSVRSGGKQGYRLEEKIEFFAQGPHLPATRTHRTEEVDLEFYPRLVAWHEEGDRGEEDGPRRYSRDVSGRVVDGEWRGSVFSAGAARIVKVRVPAGTRARLGHREHLLRIARRVRLIDARILDPDRERLVAVRAGFASVTEDASGKRPGHEFHWEEGGRRLISYFDTEQNVIREEISEGILALPVTQERAEAARSGGASPKDAESREVRLAEAGIAFTPPDRVWTWKAATGLPGHTAWRALGRLDNRVLLSDVRIEWHPHTKTSERAVDRVEAWLLRRLRGVSPDLEVVAPRRQLAGVPGAWRIGLTGTLKKESVRTIAVVVDRKSGRVVLLLACPAGAWEQIRPAMERLLASIRLL